MVFDPEKITYFAKTDARGQQTPFGIKAKDRTRHVYVIGKTGMGKSTMLENMAVQDIQNGEGLAFIDPHGQTAETLLEYIPEHRVKDVLYFAPFDMDCPVAFNIMEDVGPDKRHLVVSGLMSVFEKIWVDAWSARMAYILQNTLLALLEYPDSTLLGVNRMLSDKEYRKKVVDNIQDPGVKSFWVDEFAKYNERYMQEAGDSIKNKIGQFTANPVIRNIVGQPKSSFNIREIMDEKKILIMNLSKGLVGETNANLLGSMLTTRIYLAAMSRADLTPQQMKVMPNFYFYVDEFQSFANATFSNILSEARKYKLNLTIAHQYIEQMEEDVRNAVFGNVGTIISFRVGPFDAEELEKIFSPRFYATDICNLGFAQVYLTLMIDGIGSQPFSAVTLPPIEAPVVSCRDMVVAESRKQFANPRAEVEALVSKFHEPLTPERTERKSPQQPHQGERRNFSDSRSRDTRRNGNNGNNGGNGGGNGGSARSERPPRRESGDRRSETNEGGHAQRPKKENFSHDAERRPVKQERPTRTERPESSGQKKLDDLRSVLETLSKKEVIKSEPRQNRSEAEVAATQKKTNTDKRVSKEEMNKGFRRERVDRTEHKVSPKPLRGEGKEERSGTDSGQTTSSSVSGKELERMMRLTSSDRPPRRVM